MSPGAEDEAVDPAATLDAGERVPAPSPELLAELQRRLAAHDADPTRALTWEQVVAHVRRPRG